MAMFHRHRMDLTFRADIDSMNTFYGNFINGKNYNNARGYDGPGINTPHGTFSIGTYDMPKYTSISGFKPDTKEGYWAASDRWVTWFRTNSPTTEYFRYMLDEPDWGKNNADGTKNITWNYNYIIEKATWIKSNPGVGKNLKIFATSKVDTRLKGYVDFWSVTGRSAYVNKYEPEIGNDLMGYNIAISNQRRALGEKVGIYNSARPYFPALEYIDNDAVDPRVMTWVAWKYNVDQYFLWEINSWDFYTGSRDIFKTSIGYENGGGEIVYPGQQVKIGGEDDKGLAGPIASIRMKEFRRGMQDYEYFYMLKQKGYDPNSYINKVVYGAFDAFGTYPTGIYKDQNSAVPWEVRGDKYEIVRKDMANALTR
jgi:hypothetical protein